MIKIPPVDTVLFVDIIKLVIWFYIYKFLIKYTLYLSPSPEID